MLKVLVVVEDDPDLRLMVRTMFRMDGEFDVGGEAATARDGIEIARAAGDGLSLIVLDHQLEGDMTGLEAAPLFREAAPQAKIILWTAYPHISDAAEAEPAIDLFLLKSQVDQLLPAARLLCGLNHS